MTTRALCFLLVFVRLAWTYPDSLYLAGRYAPANCSLLHLDFDAGVELRSVTLDHCPSDFVVSPDGFIYYAHATGISRLHQATLDNDEVVCDSLACRAVDRMMVDRAHAATLIISRDGEKAAAFRTDTLSADTAFVTESPPRSGHNAAVWNSYDYSSTFLSQLQLIGASASIVTGLKEENGYQALFSSPVLENVTDAFGNTPYVDVVLSSTYFDRIWLFVSDLAVEARLYTVLSDSECSEPSLCNEGCCTPLACCTLDEANGPYEVTHVQKFVNVTGRLLSLNALYTSSNSHNFMIANSHDGGVALTMIHQAYLNADTTVTRRVDESDIPSLAGLEAIAIEWGCPQSCPLSNVCGPGPHFVTNPFPSCVTAPTHAPTETPTQLPTRAPSSTPTYEPTLSPSVAPTRLPTRTPTRLPTLAPSRAPAMPTDAPTRAPTAVPSRAPTMAPTRAPTGAPVVQPSLLIVVLGSQVMKVTVDSVPRDGELWVMSGSATDGTLALESLIELAGSDAYTINDDENRVAFRPSLAQWALIVADEPLDAPVQFDVTYILYRRATQVRVTLTADDLGALRAAGGGGKWATGAHVAAYVSALMTSAATATSSSSSSGSGDAIVNNGDGLSAEAVAGVAGGVVVLLVAIIALVACFAWSRRSGRRRGRDRAAAHGDVEMSLVQMVAKRIPDSMQLSKVTIGSVELGRGASNVVFEGTWRRQRVAVKCTTAAEASSDVDELLAEAALCCTLRPHANIITFYGVVTRPRVGLVMEKCALGSLATLLYADDEESRREFSDEEEHRLLLGIVRALAHVHAEKLVHGDVAARNVLVTRNLVAKLADFGSAVRVDDSSGGVARAKHDAAMRFAAPEQLRNYRHASSRADCFALGVLLFEVYARERPWASLNNVEASAEVLAGKRLQMPERTPTVVRDVTASVWQEAPEKRMTAADIASALGAEWADVAAAPLVSPRSPRSPRRRNRRRHAKGGSRSPRSQHSSQEGADAYAVAPQVLAKASSDRVRDAKKSSEYQLPPGMSGDYFAVPTDEKDAGEVESAPTQSGYARPPIDAAGAYDMPPTVAAASNVGGSRVTDEYSVSPTDNRTQAMLRNREPVQSDAQGKAATEAAYDLPPPASTQDSDGDYGLPPRIGKESAATEDAYDLPPTVLTQSVSEYALPPIVADKDGYDTLPT